LWISPANHTEFSSEGSGAILPHGRAADNDKPRMAVELSSEKVRVGPVTTEGERRAWNELASRSAMAHMHQCLWWSEPLTVFNVSTRVLGCWKGKQLAGGALFRSVPVPFLGMSLTECLNGPIFQEWSPQWADAFVEGIRELARAARSITVVIRSCPNPAVHRDLLEAFRRAHLRISLTPGEVEGVLFLRNRTMDDLRRGFREGTRRSLKKGLAAPVRVERLTRDDELRSAHEAWMATARRKSFLDVRPWRALEPVLRHCVESGLGSVLGTLLEDRLIAAVFVTYIGETACFVYGGYRDNAEPYRPTHLLQLAAIQESLDRGMSAYTFGGLTSHGEPRLSGVDQFKLGFGAVPQGHLDTITWERRASWHRGLRWFRSHRIGQQLERIVRRRVLDRADSEDGTSPG